jgi:hypothetical protein
MGYRAIWVTGPLFQDYPHHFFITLTMSFQPPFTPAQIEDQIQIAIIAIEAKEFKSIRAAADHFQVSRTTLGYRMAGRRTRLQAHEYRQILSNVQESTLA